MRLWVRFHLYLFFCIYNAFFIFIHKKCLPRFELVILRQKSSTTTIYPKLQFVATHEHTYIYIGYEYLAPPKKLVKIRHWHPLYLPQHILTKPSSSSPFSIQQIHIYHHESLLHFLPTNSIKSPYFLTKTLC